MELRHLRYFVGVAETLNFRAAAEDLHVSAPTLSHQIKDLEEELGVRLFDRDTTTVRLTSAGRVFFDEVRPLLARVKHAQEMAKDAARGVRGRLHVGYDSALLAEFMPRCLAVFKERFPNVGVELIDLNAAEQIAALRADTIQLGFLAPPKGSMLPPELADASVLRAMPQVLVGRGHRLASQSVVSLADLSHERLLVISGSKWAIHREHICRTFDSCHVPVGETVDVLRLDALLALVAGGEGVTLLTWRRCVAFEHQIVILPLKESGPELEVDIRAAWRGPTAPKLLQEFVDVLREAAGSSKRD